MGNGRTAGEACDLYAPRACRTVEPFQRGDSREVRGVGIKVVDAGRDCGTAAVCAARTGPACAGRIGPACRGENDAPDDAGDQQNDDPCQQRRTVRQPHHVALHLLHRFGEGCVQARCGFLGGWYRRTLSEFMAIRSGKDSQSDMSDLGMAP